MKQVLYVVCILLCSFRQKGKDDPVRLITIIKNKMTLETAVPIPCDQVSKQMPRDTFYYYQKKKQRKLLKLINEATAANRPCDIDARAQIFITHESGKIDSLCLGYTYVFTFNGQCMQLPRWDLIKMLAAMDRDIRPEEIEDSVQSK